VFFLTEFLFLILRNIFSKYTNERNPSRYDLNPSAKRNNNIDSGPESSIRFNRNDYHGTWTTAYATAAGYGTQPKSKSLDFLEKGTSSLIESDGEEQSLFVEDLLFIILTRFSEARKSLSKSIRISEASGSGAAIEWSAPEMKWFFKCLVTEFDEIPKEIVGPEDISKLQSYLSNRADTFPGAFGSIARDVRMEDVKGSGGEKGEIIESLSVVDVAIDNFERSPEPEKSETEEGVESCEDHPEILDERSKEHLEKPKINNIPKIPSIGEEWSDLGQTEGYEIAGDTADVGVFDETMPFSHVDDALLDSVGPIFESFEESSSQDSINEVILSNADDEIDKISDNVNSENVEKLKISNTDTSDFVDAKFTVAEGDDTIVGEKEGSLDRFFIEGTEICEIFGKFYADEDTISTGRNEDKASWAVQDLYTILQFTSVLKRIEAGRRYMGENVDDWFNTTFINLHSTEADTELSGSVEPTAAHNHSAVLSKRENIELARYCSSQNSDGCLRSDLRRLQSLRERNNEAAGRILGMMDGGEFTEESVGMRGYSWLRNVLKFNEMKVLEWNDIIESKESFLYSDEELEDLEDILYSDWNELSDPNVMWEYEENVDTNHRSHFVDEVTDLPDSESAEAFTKRFEAEWDVDSWEHQYDQEQNDGKIVDDTE